MDSTNAEIKTETTNKTESKTTITTTKSSTIKPITKTAIMGRNRGAVLRLQQDYINLNKDPVPYIRAEPLSWNILEWHYVISGPENSPYYGGYYHGTLVFTQQYPFKPPSIYIRTPNGRFQTNRRLCLSISDYHPDEWNPAWSVSSILTGLLSFMLEDSSALGTMVTLRKEKLQFAYDSLEFNLKNHNFTTLFPDLVKEINHKLKERAENESKIHSQQPNTDDSSGNRSANGHNPIIDRNNRGVNNDGFPHMILIICFCLGALIIHHAYNLDQLN